MKEKDQWVAPRSATVRDSFLGSGHAITVSNRCVFDIQIQREDLGEIVNLEVVVSRGLRLLGLCLCMFIFVMYTAMLEADSDDWGFWKTIGLIGFQKPQLVFSKRA